MQGLTSGPTVRHAYKRLFDPRRPTFVFQVFLFGLTYLLSSTWILFILAVGCIQLINLLVQYNVYYVYARNALNTDMVDLDLIAWTNNNNQTGFLVAEVKNLVVGIIAFKKVGEFLEINRFSVDPAFRRLGIGKLLTDEVMKNGKKLDCCWLLAATTFGQKIACSYYERTGWVEASSSRAPFLFFPYFIHGTEFIDFHKKII
ncbi:probable N-acetyltransferase CML1 isoform X2 [Eurytemora carolleeae]|uniref:probable N-acetyltransferase CML1 isoform X2 n=1 Tax=Eurytemora carolleeae TaxID=1294199 RepID=UPI000C761DAF|nr:probable N-acetyltransferase CML1 isoform X2 [Eurytemora carolleeae]|eukprot:XP_023345145.1 probable N-acetyltransferase CML1 isoform X2 [Eurytemora affinis]